MSDITKQEMISSFAEQRNGYLLTSDVTGAGISKTYLAEYIKKYNYKRVAQGVYISDDAWPDELYVLSLRNQEAVLSHETALYLHGLMEREPSCTMITVSRSYNATHLRKSGCKVHTVDADVVNLGRITVQTNYGNPVFAYDMERTICDIVKCKDKMDIQLFSTAIREYMKSSRKHLPNLMLYAQKLGVEKAVKTYVEVMI